MVSHNHDKFGGHRHCEREDTMALVCHLSLEDHVIKGLCGVMGKSSSRLVTLGIAVVEILTFLEHSYKHSNFTANVERLIRA